MLQLQTLQFRGCALRWRFSSVSFYGTKIAQECSASYGRKKTEICLLTLCEHMKTAKQWISNTVIGTLAVDGWAVTFGTVRRSLGGLRPTQSPPRCTKCNIPPINGQCTNCIYYKNIIKYSMWRYNCLCALKGWKLNSASAGAAAWSVKRSSRDLSSVVNDHSAPWRTDSSTLLISRRTRTETVSHPRQSPPPSLSAADTFRIWRETSWSFPLISTSNHSVFSGNHVRAKAHNSRPTLFYWATFFKRLTLL